MQSFMTLWDDDLGHDEMTTIIDKTYERLIVDSNMKTAARVSHNSVTFGVCLKNFVSLVCSELREQHIKFKSSVVRARCETQLRDKHNHPITPQMIRCLECGRVFPRRKALAELRRCLQERYDNHLEASECCNPTVSRRICVPSLCRNVLCGARLVGT